MAGKDSFFITKNFDPLILQTVLKRNWIVLSGIFLICFSIAFFYLRYTKPIYQSSMVIQLIHDDKAKDVLNMENVNIDPSLNSDIELLRSQLIMEQAIQKLNLNVSVFQKGKILSEEKYLSGDFLIQPYELKDSSLVGTEINLQFETRNKVLLSYEFNGERKVLKGRINQHIGNEHFNIVIKVPRPAELYSKEQNEYYFIFNSTQSLTSRFLSNLEVVPIDPSAKTIGINLTGFNPVFCRDMLNAVVGSFFAYDLFEKKKGSENILKYIDNQLDSLAQELETSKDSLINYQRKTNLVSPEMAESFSSGNLTKLQEELSNAQQELKLIKRVNVKLKSEPSRLEVYRLLPEMFGSSFEEALAKRIDELHSLLEKKEDLLYSVTEDNPQIITMNNRIQIKMNSIRKSASIIEDRINENIRSIQSKLSTAQGEAYQVPEKKMEFGRLRNIQDLNEKYFALFTERKVVYAISDAGFSSAHRVLSRPEIYSVPISPDKKKTYSLALGLGFFAGFIFLFVRYVRFNEINYLEDLKKILPSNLSYLGAIPKVEADMVYSEVIVQDNPKSMISESLRGIRTNLNFVRPNYKTIAISSSISSEGKTFVALNLAAIIAMTGKKTLLIDLDMRKPKIHLAMKVQNKKGMSNAIIGQIDWKECIQPSKIENLDFISAGAIPPNPSELMMSQELSDIIVQMKEEYDVIVFDNPPVGVVSDGVQMMANCDVPIYVFKANYSKRNFAERVEELVEVQKIKKLSIILNGAVSVNKSYGYGGHYGYYEEKETKKSFIKRIFGL